MRFYRGEHFDKASSTTELRKEVGFYAKAVGRTVTIEAVIEHILDDTRSSPFISLTASRRVAAQFAADSGAIFEIELPDTVQLINPCSFIIEWLISNKVWKGELFSRAEEARQMATKDEEWLAIGWLPPDSILSIEEVSDTH